MAKEGASAVAEAAKAAPSALAEAARAALDLTVITPGGFSVSLKIDNTILAGISVVGALSLGAFYVANKWRVENALRNGLENRNEVGVVDPEIRNIEVSSILVELHCHSEHSFLKLVEDFESEKVKHRLEEEFTKIGFQSNLTVALRNADEVYKKVKEIRLSQESSKPRKVEDKGVQKIVSQGFQQKEEAIPICIPNNCNWDETTDVMQRDYSQPRTGIQLVNVALGKLRSIQGPVCVVSIAGPYRRGKSCILRKVFDQEDVFPLGHSFDPETMGIWMWVVPEKYKDGRGREFTVVLLDSEGTDPVGAEGITHHFIFTLYVLLSSVLIYNSVGVPTQTNLEGIDYIIKLSQRIQVIAGQSLDDEDSRKVFPSFVWLLRDVVLRLPTGLENLNQYFLEKVFKGQRRSGDKSQKVVNNILKFFPDFDAFALSPPSRSYEVIRYSTEKGRHGDINLSFLKEVEDFKQMLRTKQGTKRSFGEEGVVTGEDDDQEGVLDGLMEALNTGSAFRDPTRPTRKKAGGKKARPVDLTSITDSHEYTSTENNGGAKRD